MSAFELHRRARQWPNQEEARLVKDRMFELLLTRVIENDDKDIRVVIHTVDPAFKNPARHHKDRVYLIDANDPSNRMGVALSRLLPEIALTCVALMDDPVYPGHMGGSRPVVTASSQELAKLSADAKVLIGSKKLINAFRPAAPASQTRETRPVAYGVAA